MKWNLKATVLARMTLGTVSTRNLELGVLVAAQETKDRLRPMQYKKLEFRFSHTQDF